MITLLAQAPSATALKDSLEVIFYLAGLVAAIAVAWGYLTGRSSKTEIANQPIDVRAHPGVVTSAELKQVHGRIERERAEINAAIRSVSEASERRADKLETSLKENTALTQRMSGEVSQINQSVQTLTSSLTNFLQHQARRE